MPIKGCALLGITLLVAMAEITIRVDRATASLLVGTGQAQLCVLKVLTITLVMGCAFRNHSCRNAGASVGATGSRPATKRTGGHKNASCEFTLCYSL